MQKMRVVSAWVSIVQCPVWVSIPVCHAVSCCSCVRGFWREYLGQAGAWCTLLTWDCVWLSRVEPDRSCPDQERGSLVSVSRNSERSCRAQLHNIRPAVGSCHKEKITGRVQTTGPGEAWPRLSSVGIMAPNLTWDLIICEGLSVEHWSPTSSHPQPTDQTGWEWSTDGRTNSDTSLFLDVVFSDWFQWLEMNCLNILTRLEAVVRWRSYHLMAAYLLRFFGKTWLKLDSKDISTDTDRRRCHILTSI